MMSWNHANSECTGDEHCCHPCPEARVKLVTEVFQFSERGCSLLLFGCRRVANLGAIAVTIKQEQSTGR